MTRQEILSANKEIALFMGGSTEHEYNGSVCFLHYKNNKAPYYILFTRLKYHRSWDWLIPVVEKIAKDYDVKITWMPTGMDVTYIDRPETMDGEISSTGGMTAIENTYIAVVRFIEWYNTKSVNRKKN